MLQKYKYPEGVCVCACVSVRAHQHLLAAGCVAISFVLCGFRAFVFTSYFSHLVLCVCELRVTEN